MLLFRLILLFAMAFIAWRLYRLVVAPRVRASEQPPKLDGEDMVECALCSVHVPRAQAVSEASRWYCCEEHRREHTESSTGT
ncbi:MAG TPA: PP0621 family protein [Pseudomonadales bacterium]|nr:PP0621 family protein [Pseudomonadales bacterium]